MNEHIVNPDEKSPLKITETGNPFEFDIISGSIDRDIYKQSVAYLSHPLGFTYTYRYISELRFKDDYGLRKVYNVRMLEVRCLNGNDLAIVLSQYLLALLSLVPEFLLDILLIQIQSGYEAEYMVSDSF